MRTKWDNRKIVAVAQVFFLPSPSSLLKLPIMSATVGGKEVTAILKCCLDQCRRMEKLVKYVFFVEKTVERILLYSFWLAVYLFKLINQKIYCKISKYLVNREASNHSSVECLRETRNKVRISSIIYYNYWDNFHFVYRNGFSSILRLTYRHI